MFGRTAFTSDKRTDRWLFYTKTMITETVNRNREVVKIIQRRKGCVFEKGNNPKRRFIFFCLNSLQDFGFFPLPSVHVSKKLITIIAMHIISKQRRL